jgi:hypothetical protein
MRIFLIKRPNSILSLRTRYRAGTCAAERKMTISWGKGVETRSEISQTVKRADISKLITVTGTTLRIDFRCRRGSPKFFQGYGGFGEAACLFLA